MTQPIEIIKNLRNYLLTVIDGLSVEQFNKTPGGFNNNIIWNLGHLIATQQRICYLRSGLQSIVQNQYFAPYISGTKPDAFIATAEVETIKSLLISTIDELESDYKRSCFTTYNFTTRYGVGIASIDDAVKFLPYHEGMHTNAILTLKKFV